MFNRDFAFNPARDIANVLLWWDPSTAAKIIGGSDNSDGYSRLVSRAGRCDAINNAGATFSLVPTIDTTSGLTYAGVGSHGGNVGLANATSLAAQGLTAATIFVAANKAGNNDDNAYYNRWGGAADDSFHGYSGNGTVFDDFGSTVRQNFAHAVNFTGRHIICTRARTGQWDFWADGVNQYSTTTNTFSFAGATVKGAFIPRTNTSTGFYEAMIVGRYITDAEMWDLYRYMSAKWKIPLSAGPKQFRSGGKFRRLIFPTAPASTFTWSQMTPGEHQPVRSRPDVVAY